MRHRLAQPIDGAGLAAFRFFLGVILCVQTTIDVVGGRVETTYLDTRFRFTYLGFDWVQPGPWLNVVFIISAISAMCVAIGFRHRLTATVLFVCRTYVFLLERTEYLNHEYLICVLVFLLALSPAGAAWSIDARRRGTSTGVARIWVMVLLAQLGIVYGHAAIAKLNPDWLAGEPIRSWLAERTDKALIGPLLDYPLTVGVFVFGGIAFDALVTPLLLWRRTRPLAVVWSFLFHGLNKLLFSIGVFPWVMLAATTLFLTPGWPRRLLRRKTPPPLDAARPGRLTICFLALFLVIQLLVPLRHHLYPGSVHWTEEGHEFSWHMKLRDKNGTIEFIVFDPTSGREFVHSPRVDCTPRQIRKMAGRPDLIHQYALHVRETWERRGLVGVKVFAHSRASLNGRPPQWLIDRRFDLAAAPRSIRHSPWIVPLTTPLK